MQIDPIGDSAAIVRVDGKSGEEMIDRVLATRQAILDAEIPGVIETTPAYTTIGIFYDAARVTFRDLAAQIEAIIPNVRSGSRSQRLVEIPVEYGGEFGPDLAEVAAHTGLNADEIVRRHTAADYLVSCVGFTPGFPYLSGLPNELSMPRRATLRKQVPAGSVAIGGSQTGVYPTASPGGWNLIGRTNLALFDPQREPPALLQAGDRVRFRSTT